MAPQVSEKKHFGASRLGKTSTVEPCSTEVLFTKVNSFFFFKFQKTSASELIHSHCSHEKFRVFFSSEKPVQLINFIRTIHMNVNNFFFVY